MPDLLDVFLKEGSEQAIVLCAKESLSEKAFSGFENKKAFEEFFCFVRNAAPFVGFFRADALAESGLEALRRDGGDVKEKVLEKTKKLKEVLSNGLLLGYEPAAKEDEEDVFSLVSSSLQQANGSDELEQAAFLLKEKEKNLLKIQAALDEKSAETEKLKQMLLQKQDELKQTENVIEKNRKKQEDDQQKIDFLTHQVSEKAEEIAERLRLLTDKEAALKSSFEAFEEREKEQQMERRDLEAEAERLEEFERTLSEAHAALEERKTVVETAQNEYERLTLENAQKEEALTAFNEQLKFLETTLNGKLRETDELQKILSDKISDTERRLKENNEDKEQALSQVREISLFAEGLQEKYALKMQLNAELTHKLKQMEDENNKLNVRLASLEADFSYQKNEAERLSLKNAKEGKILESLTKECENLREKAFLFDALAPNFETTMQEILTLTDIRAVLKEKLNDENLLLQINDVKAQTEKTALKLFLKPLSVLKSVLESYAAELFQTYNRRVFLNVRIDDNVRADAVCCEAVFEIVKRCLENTLRYAVPENEDNRENVIFSVQITSDWEEISVCISDNGAGVAYDTLRLFVDRAFPDTDVSALSDEAVLQYLLCDKIAPSSHARGLVFAQNAMQELNGKITLFSNEKESFGIRFSLPATSLFAQGLIFSNGRDEFAVPLYCIAETRPVSLSEVETKENAHSIVWRETKIPLIDLNDFENRSSGVDAFEFFAVIIQTGMCVFAIKALQVIGTEKIMAQQDSREMIKNPVLPKIAILENAHHARLIDFLALTRLLQLPPAMTGISASDEKAAQEMQEVVEKESFLIYKTSPENYQAIAVAYVECIEDFANFGIKKSEQGDCVVFSGELLPVLDSCPNGRFFYARSLLILNYEGKRLALAIQEITDIVELNKTELVSDVLSFQGKDVYIVSKKDF